MENHPPAIAVLYHLFYEDSAAQVCAELQPLLALHPLFLFNICNETPGRREMAETLRATFSNSYVIFTSNQGKDIGGKLALLELLRLLGAQPDYLILLHDKRSFQALKSATWKKDLLKIVAEEGIAASLRIFNDNPHCAMVATREYIMDEPVDEGHFQGRNGSQLDALVQQYALAPASWQFVGGTMFWARAAPLLHFFEHHPPLGIRKTLERGNVLDNFQGTITHAWERLLSWISTANNYSIKGL